MKLVFYGGGDERDQEELDRAAIRLAGIARPHIAYIPSTSYWADVDFKTFAKHYQKTYAVQDLILFPVDIPFDKILLKEALKSDIIHLAGGNTYYFLKHLRKSGMIRYLRDFVARGGVLSGISAGGILMTPDIVSAGYPSFDCDENEERIKNFKALNLAKFEFCPHYKNSTRFERELLTRSRKTCRPIYASPDGHGIVVNGDNIEFIGRNYCFFRGRKLSLAA